MPNTDALVDTLEYILIHPEEWNQGVWHCGTAYCYAGHATVHIFGASVARDHMVTLTAEHAALLNENEVNEEIRMTYVYDPARPWQAGDEVHVAEFAMVGLGLTSDQGSALFAPTNTLGDLKHYIELFSGIELPGIH